jgi:integrase
MPAIAPTLASASRSRLILTVSPLPTARNSSGRASISSTPLKRGNVWWYEFWFAGRRVRESSKTGSKTLAKAAEQKRRRELEEGFNNLEDVRQERVRTIQDLAYEYLISYKLRHPRSVTFAEYALGHVKRLLGDKMLVDINEETVKEYQESRLREKTAPKSINEEIGFLLRIMDVPGDVLRVRLRKKKLLKLKAGTQIGKAFGPEEKARLIEHAKAARSPHIYPALMLALNAGMRDAEMKTLTWAQINFEKRYLAVGRSKTEAGEGRTIPLNSVLHEALSAYSKWYEERFGEIRPEWYVFPFGKLRPNDPTRPVTTLKTAWQNLRKKAKVTGRWHDNRHTLVTELAESGASDQTIMDIAGHVSKQMLKHYSHIRMEAKRTALESIVQKEPAKPAEPEQNHSQVPTVKPQIEGQSPQKSPQPGDTGQVCRGKMDRKSLKRIGSSGRIRTYNPSVNSRMLYR